MYDMFRHEWPWQQTQEYKDRRRRRRADARE